MLRKFSIIASFSIALAGCEASTLFDEDVAGIIETDSGQIDVDTDGVISTTQTILLSGSDVTTGNGYAYVIGYEPDTQLVEARAGIATTTDLGMQPTSGAAVMTGTYEVGQVDALDLDDDNVPMGTSTTESGTITLTADFFNETLTGSSGNLTVAGEMSDGALTGIVTYQGLDGTLVGEIGETDAVGAFYGHDANTVFAGGFRAAE